MKQERAPKTHGATLPDRADCLGRGSYRAFHPTCLLALLLCAGANRIAHHPLCRCHTPWRPIGTDPKHVVGQPERAARHWEGSTPSPRPRQLLLEYADKTLQWLGTRQQPAVDEKSRVPVTLTRVPSSTFFCTKACWVPRWFSHGRCRTKKRRHRTLSP